MMAVGRGSGGAFALALAAWCGLFVAVRLWSGAAPSAVSSLLLAGAPSTSSGSSSSGVYAWGSTNNVKLFKRTHASTHPQRDGWFLSHYVGVEQTAAEFWMNGSQYSSKMTTGDGETTGVLFETACGLEGVACCAERASMTTLGTFTFHQFRSWVTPAGDASIDDWVSFWNGLRSFSRAALDVPYDWDAYMSLSTHFYTPRLDAHVRRLVAEDVPFLSRTYAMLWRFLWRSRRAPPVAIAFLCLHSTLVRPGGGTERSGRRGVRGRPPSGSERTMIDSPRVRATTT